MKAIGFKRFGAKFKFVHVSFLVYRLFNRGEFIALSSVFRMARNSLSPLKFFNPPQYGWSYFVQSEACSSSLQCRPLRKCFDRKGIGHATFLEEVLKFFILGGLLGRSVVRYSSKIIETSS